MSSVANIFLALIIGLVVVALIKSPGAITDFFNGTKGNLTLLTK